MNINTVFIDSTTAKQELETTFALMMEHIKNDRPNFNAEMAYLQEQRTNEVREVSPDELTGDGETLKQPVLVPEAIMLKEKILAIIGYHGTQLMATGMTMDKCGIHVHNVRDVVIAMHNMEVMEHFVNLPDEYHNLVTMVYDKDFSRKLETACEMAREGFRSIAGRIMTLPIHGASVKDRDMIPAQDSLNNMLHDFVDEAKIRAGVLLRGKLCG